MAKIKVHYANFPYLEVRINSGVISIKKELFQMTGEIITGDKIVNLEVCTEGNVKKIGGALGWGVAGGMIIGPLGVVAGAILGGNKKEVTFIAEINDGRKFMGTATHQEFTELTASKIRFDEILNIQPISLDEEQPATFDDEMRNKANRMYREPDYMAWKVRTGEAEIIKIWMEVNNYYPPGYKE